MYFTRIDRAAVIEIVLCTALMMIAMFIAFNAGINAPWSYVVMGLLIFAGGVWLERILRRSKKRQASS